MRIVFPVVLGMVLIAWGFVPSTLADSDESSLRSINLRCEYLVNPLGVEERVPRLTWTADSARRNERVTAYRILVASSHDHLEREDGDLWDSGKVDSNSTTLIEYAGKSLTSRRVCHWKVKAWDRDGKAGVWSEAARWEMGLLEASDWGAPWIDATPSAIPVEIVSASYASMDGKVRKDVTKVVADMVARGEKIVARNDTLGGDPAVNVPKRLHIEYRCGGATLRADAAENAEVVLARSRIPYLRKSFDVGDKVVRARLYTTALGVYRLSVNGRGVGDTHLAPGWTDYRKRVRYQTYDLTPLLSTGKNTLGVMVGPGWFSGRAGLFHAREFYGTAPAFLAQLEITYADGRVDRICSDTTWRRHDGPLLAADMMDGVVYDARAELPDWALPGMDDSAWKKVTARDERRTLQADIDRPVRELQVLSARALTQPVPGRWVFDLGQNMVGAAKLRTRAKVGTVVTMRHAEMLNPDGTIYVQNLRGAGATDVYISKGGEQEWLPEFTFHGFRYVELTGLDEPPELGDVAGVVLGSDLERVGEFSCSDARLNQLQSNIVWGLRGNYLSIPTDCPQRDERMGWMADAQVFTPTAAFNADITPFMMKWLGDIRDAQRDDGAYPDVAPVMKGLAFGTPAWGDAGTMVPWSVYQMTGDGRILARHIGSMARWVDWCVAHSTNFIRDRDRGNDYGDWLSIHAETPKDLIGTAYFARSAAIVRDCYRVLGDAHRAEAYSKIYEDVRGAFIRRYVMNAGKVAGETQCAYLLALRFDLLPSDRRGLALQHLVDDIERQGHHLSTGFVGVANLLPVLSSEGRSDVAYRLLLQETFPSWLFSVKQGATTIWERWDGWTPDTGPHPDWGMNSFNHYSLGSCGEWFYSGIAGIQFDPKAPGFSRMRICPNVHSALTHASARYESIRGRIESRWARDAGGITYSIRIPTNTTATIELDASVTDDISESGRELSKSVGVRGFAMREGKVVLEVGSGEYTFRVAQSRRP